MMETTTKQCRQLYLSKNGQQSSLASVRKPSTGKSYENRDNQRRNLTSVREEKRSVIQEERKSDKKASKTSIMSKLVEKDDRSRSDRHSEETSDKKRITALKLKEEPSDLSVSIGKSLSFVLFVFLFRRSE